MLTEETLRSQRRVSLRISIEQSSSVDIACVYSLPEFETYLCVIVISTTMLDSGTLHSSFIMISKFISLSFDEVLSALSCGMAYQDIS